MKVRSRGVGNLEELQGDRGSDEDVQVRLGAPPNDGLTELAK